MPKIPKRHIIRMSGVNEAKWSGASDTCTENINVVDRLVRQVLEYEKKGIYEYL